MPDEKTGPEAQASSKPRSCIQVDDGKRCELDALPTSQYCAKHRPSRGGGGGGSFSGRWGRHEAVYAPTRFPDDPN
jgi:hypothetical protein